MIRWKACPILFLILLWSCNKEVKLDAEALGHTPDCDTAFSGEALLTVAPEHEANQRIYFKEDCKLKGYDLTALKEVRLKWKSCLKGDETELRELKVPKIENVLEKGYKKQSKIIEPEKGVEKEKYFRHYYAAINRMEVDSTVGQFCRSIIAVMNVWKKQYKQN